MEYDVLGRPLTDDKPQGGFTVDENGNKKRILLDEKGRFAGLGDAKAAGEAGGEDGTSMDEASRKALTRMPVAAQENPPAADSPEAPVAGSGASGTLPPVAGADGADGAAGLVFKAPT